MKQTTLAVAADHGAELFNLADEACEEALLDSTALRRFVGIDLGRERA